MVLFSVPSSLSQIDSETDSDLLTKPEVAVSSWDSTVNDHASDSTSPSNISAESVERVSDGGGAALVARSSLKIPLGSDKNNNATEEQPKSGILGSARLVDARLRPSGIQGHRCGSSTAVPGDGGLRSHDGTRVENDDAKWNVHRHIHSQTQIVEDTFFRFLDLPKELALDILEHCELETLRALTATSRFINEIAFKTFLAASNLILPNDSVVEHARGPYGAVQISTPEQALALLVWKRHSSFHRVGVLSLMLELAADQSAIVVDRSLSFFGSPMPFPQPFATMINVYVSSIENVYIEATRLLYGLQYSRCARLSITGLTHISDLPNSTLYYLPLLEPTDTGYSELEVFHACGSYPFLPQILPFTMHNILSSNLRELELNMNGFCVMRWSIILRDLFLPNLEKLGFGGAIAIVTILKFLRRHKNLRSLSLCGITVSFARPDLPSRFMLSFSNLEYIRAPSLYLGEILKRTRRATTSISRIAILTDFYKPFSFGNSAALRCSSVNLLLREVSRFPSITNLEFHFSRSASTEFCNFSQDMACGPPETLLPLVKKISLHKNIGTPFSNEALAKTVDWISLFPSVCSAELWETSYNDRTSWISALRSRGVETYHYY